MHIYMYIQTAYIYVYTNIGEKMIEGDGKRKGKGQGVREKGEKEREKEREVTRPSSNCRIWKVIDWRTHEQARKTHA